MGTHPEVRTLLRTLLEVVDNLERAVGTSERGEAEPGVLLEGVRSIHRQLADVLYRYGVRPFVSEGTAFDPARHEALGQVRVEGIPPRQVVQEIRKGYLSGEDLFRAAQVLVSVESARQATPAAGLPATLLKPTGERMAERSAPSRPGWLLNPPQATPRTRYAVGKASAAADPESGLALARDAGVLSLMAELAPDVEEGPIRQTWLELTERLSASGPHGLWPRLCETVPGAEQWLQDHYWEQVRGEIRGRVFDVAVLLGLDRSQEGSLLPSLQAAERWGGLVLVDGGGLIRAVSGGVVGALLVEIHPGGTAWKCGLHTGDVIFRVGNRPTEDAAAARRLLSLNGQGRRIFEVEVLRGLAQGLVIKIDPRRG